MDSFIDLCTRRSDRALCLADRFPASCEVLSFYASLVSFQQQIYPQLRDWETLITFRIPLVKLVCQIGPPLLQETAQHLDETTCRRALSDYWQRSDSGSPLSFFARVLLQPYLASL